MWILVGSKEPILANAILKGVMSFCNTGSVLDSASSTVSNWIKPSLATNAYGWTVSLKPWKKKKKKKKKKKEKKSNTNRLGSSYNLTSLKLATTYP